MKSDDNSPNAAVAVKPPVLCVLIVGKSDCSAVNADLHLNCGRTAKTPLFSLCFSVLMAG